MCIVELETLPGGSESVFNIEKSLRSFMREVIFGMHYKKRSVLLVTGAKVF